MANKQIIFVVETSSKKRIDDIYINKLIINYYDLRANNLTYKFVHMDGKRNYKSKKIVEEISKYINENENGDNTIIYCIDTDRIDFDSSEVDFFNDVKNYCTKKNYELVWFCYNIEHVFLGQSVTRDDKVMTANKFARMNFDFNKIKKNLSFIDNERCIPKKSNIITILDKYFVKKKK